MRSRAALILLAFVLALPSAALAAPRVEEDRTPIAFIVQMVQLLSRGADEPPGDADAGGSDPSAETPLDGDQGADDGFASTPTSQGESTTTTLDQGTNGTTTSVGGGSNGGTASASSGGGGGSSSGESLLDWLIGIIFGQDRPWEKRGRSK